MTVSVGIASYPEHADTAEGLLGAADAAVYDAKLGGRNRSRETHRASRSEIRRAKLELGEPGGFEQAGRSPRSTAGEDRGHAGPCERVRKRFEAVAGPDSSSSSISTQSIAPSAAAIRTTSRTARSTSTPGAGSSDARKLRSGNRAVAASA